MSFYSLSGEWEYQPRFFFILVKRNIIFYYKISMYNIMYAELNRAWMYCIKHFFVCEMFIVCIVFRSFGWCLYTTFLLIVHRMEIPHYDLFKDLLNERCKLTEQLIASSIEFYFPIFFGCRQEKNIRNSPTIVAELINSQLAVLSDSFRV